MKSGLTKVIALCMVLSFALFNTACTNNGGAKGDKGNDGEDGTNGIDGEDGTSIMWLGSSTGEPVACSTATLNNAYYNTADGISYVCNGTVWSILFEDSIDGSDGISITWVGSHATDPSSCDIAHLNNAYYNSTNGISYVCNGSAWSVLSQDGSDGSNGTNGISIVWVGSSGAEPSACDAGHLNNAYFNTGSGIAYICDGNSWETLVSVGVDTTPPSVLNKTITIENVDKTTVKISWNAATDNISGILDIEYIVVYSLSDNIGTLEEINANGEGGYIVNRTTTTISGLTAYKLYYFNVIAKDAAGNGTAYTAASKTMKDVINNGDYTVTDTTTGLTWKKCSQGQNDDATCSGTAGTFQFCNESDNDCNGGVDGGILGPPWLQTSGALGASSLWGTCESLNSGAGFAGRTDWRVPTIAELNNLFENAYLNNLDLFPNVPKLPNAHYWSSSANLYQTTDAWLVDFYNGGMTSFDKLNSRYVRCVAGP